MEAPQPAEAEHADPKAVSGADGGYAWVVAGAVLAAFSVSWGINTTYGVYVSFLTEHDTLAGGSPLRYSFVGGLSIATALASSPVMSVFVGACGPRIPFSIGILGVVLGQCLAGLCTSFGPYLVCQGLVFGMGLGAIMLSSQTLLSQWFDRRLGLAQGLANAGSGLGGLVLANTTRLLMERLSLTKTLVINGGVAAAVLLPCLCLLRTGPIDRGVRREPLALRWLWHRRFVWVWTWGFTAMMGYCIALYTLASFAADGLGLAQGQAAALQSLLAAGFLAGRPLAGQLLDAGGRVRVALLLNAAAGALCWALWLPARSFALLAVFALAQGCTGGAVWVAAAPVAVQTVGPAHAAAALAVFWPAVAPAAAVASPAAVGLLHCARARLGVGVGGRAGPAAYALPIGVCGALFVLSSLCLGGALWAGARDDDGAEADVVDEAGRAGRAEPRKSGPDPVA